MEHADDPVLKSRTASSPTPTQGSSQPAPNVRLVASVTGDSDKNLLVVAGPPPLLPSPSRCRWWKLLGRRRHPGGKLVLVEIEGSGYLAIGYGLEMQPRPMCIVEGPHVLFTHLKFSIYIIYLFKA